MKKNEYLLYAITDRTWLGERTLEDDVAQALDGGVTMVQIREKDLPVREYIARAQAVKAVCDRFGVPLIVNDEVDVALAVGAAGVHLGASDGDPAAARAMLGAHAIIGATARTAEAARAAQTAGVTYLGCGAVFGTTTKRDAHTISPALFRAVTAAVTIPVVAIGGVSADNAEQLADCGAAGLCVISALFAQTDITKAARQLFACAEKVCI